MALCHLSYHAFAGLAERYHGGGGTGALCVSDNYGLAALDDRNTRVCSTQINADCLCHSKLPLFIIFSYIYILLIVLVRYLYHSVANDPVAQHIALLIHHGNNIFPKALVFNMGDSVAQIRIKCLPDFTH